MKLHLAKWILSSILRISKKNSFTKIKKERKDKRIIFKETACLGNVKVNKVWTKMNTILFVLREKTNCEGFQGDVFFVYQNTHRPRV